MFRNRSKSPSLSFVLEGQRFTDPPRKGAGFNTGFNQRPLSFLWNLYKNEAVDEINWKRDQVVTSKTNDGVEGGS